MTLTEPALSSPTDVVFDAVSVRRDFPALHQTVNGRPLVYLDSAATAQKPQAVIDAVRHYYETDNANIHRGVHTLSVRATQAYEQARSKVQRFIGAERPEEIIFVRSATEAINLIAQSCARPRLKPGDKILVTGMEHHSNIVPWQLVAGQTGATVEVAPLDDRGDVILEEFERLLGPRTKIAAFVQVSNALGTVNPVATMIDVARRNGTTVVVDGAQAVPHMPVDVAKLTCDFYVFSGHKMFGPTGIGVLYGRHELLSAMPPYQGGGEMIQSVSFVAGTTFADPPARFEAGTPHIAGAVGLGAAVDYLASLDSASIGRYEAELLAYGTEMLTAIPQVALIGTAKRKASVLSFVLEGIHAHDAGTLLDESGVAVRTGHHCAQPVMERYGVPATCRASLALYNTKEDIDALVCGIRRVVEVFR